MEEQNINNLNEAINPAEITSAPSGTANVASAPPGGVKTVGVRFKRAGRIYYFDPAGLELEVNDWVIVETTRGLEVARVVISPKQVLSNDVETPLKPVVRKAEKTEVQRNEEIESKEKEALIECAKIITRIGLPMK